MRSIDLDLLFHVVVPVVVQSVYATGLKKHCHVHAGAHLVSENAHMYVHACNLSETQTRPLLGLNKNLQLAALRMPRSPFVDLTLLSFYFICIY